MAIYLMVSFSGGVVGVKHRPTASNWRCITVTFKRKKIWIVYKNLSNEFHKQIWLGQKSAKWNQIEHALGRTIKFSGFLWSLEDASLILNLSYVTVQHVYGSASLSYVVNGGFNEGADGRVSTYINIWNNRKPLESDQSESPLSQVSPPPLTFKSPRSVSFW
jgi:hypothetical protein